MKPRSEIVRTISFRDIQGTYDVYLVGFPYTDSRRAELDLKPKQIYPGDWLHLAPHLAPEANVFDVALFSNNSPKEQNQRPPVIHEGTLGSEGTGLKAELDVTESSNSPSEDVNTDGPCSTGVLQHEARSLLNAVKTSDPTSIELEWRPIIFVGYQLGGLVVKQALAISNTEPYYHDIALRTHKLVFVATPHHEGSLAQWENTLDAMILSSGVETKGRKSTLLADLAVSANEASAYSRGALNYQVINLPDHIEPSASMTPTSKPPVTPDLISAMVSGSEPLFETRGGEITELDLRDFLTLGSVLTSTDHMWGPRLFYADFLDFLQLLSPSNHLIYYSSVWHTIDDAVTLELHGHHLTNQQLWGQRNIQVIGSPHHDTATFVKVIAKKAMLSTKNAILLDVTTEPHVYASPDFLALLRSFVYQILSQRPVLFSQIRSLFLQHKDSYGLTRLDVLEHILRIILQTSQDWKVVIAAAHFERGILLKFVELFESSECDYLLVIGSSEELTDSLKTSTLVLNLSSDDVRRSLFIQSMVSQVLLSRSVIEKPNPPERYMKPQLPEVVSIAHAQRYTTLLSRTILQSTCEAVDVALMDCPRTEAAIFDYCIRSLDTRLSQWCNMMISWVQKAARPLRVRELAVAITLRNDPIEVTEMAYRISGRLEDDIARHLDKVLKVDHGLVYFHATNTRKVLDEKLSDSVMAGWPPLISHGQIVCLCLQYLTAIISQRPGSLYDGQMEWHDQLSKCQERRAELDFLDYAVHFWPIHYRAHTGLDLGFSNSDALYPGPHIEADNVDTQVLAFLNADSFRTRWYRLFQTKNISRNATIEIGALEVATELGFPLIVNALLPTTTDEPAEPTSGDLANIDKLLRIAVRHDRIEIAEMFVARGGRKEASFLEAASRGRVDYLDKLFDDALLQGCQERLLEYAIHRAAQSGSLMAIKFCEKRTVDWNWEDENKSSMLHAAVIGGKLEILEHMLGGRALDLNSRDKAGRTPLMVATQLHHTRFVEALCKRGADVMVADNHGKTALDFAILMNCDVVELLLQHNARPVGPDFKMQTPLHRACALGDTSMVKKLVEALQIGDSINAQDENGKTPLHNAAACGNTDLVRFLLMHNANNSAEDSCKQKPIALAAAGGHLGVFETLYIRLEPSLETRQQLILQSVSIGQLLIVRFLLKSGINVDFHVNKESPLAMAASRGYIEIVRLLLQNNADPNFSDGEGLTPLYRAVKGGHGTAVAILLYNRADPDPLAEERWTPLLHAASKEMVDVVGILLEGRANVNARNIVKNTALHLSVRQPEIIKKILQYKPDLAPLNYAGETPLHLAVMGQCSETVALLIDQRSELIHTINEKNQTPLHTSIETRNTQIFRMLFSKGGFELDQECYRHAPLIFHALEYSNLDAVRFLLAKEPAMAATRNSTNMSTLHTAVQMEQLEIIDELLEASSDLDVNGRAHHGSTPLHCVKNASGNGTAILEKLIAFKADVNAVNDDGETALYQASWNGDLTMVKCLLGAGADPNIRKQTKAAPLYAAADSGLIVEELLSHGAEIDSIENNHGRTALMQAVYWSSEGSIRKLLDRNANIELTDFHGRTALHLAQDEQNPRLSQILLQAGANVAVVDAMGRTPLHYAAKSRGLRSAHIGYLIDHLIDHGATINPKDNEGDTPLHLAAASYTGPRAPVALTELIKAHVQRGLDIDEKNKKQQTPLHMALNSGSFEGSKVLMDREDVSLTQQDANGNACLAHAAIGPDSGKKIQYLFERRQWNLDEKVLAFTSVSKNQHLSAALIIARHDKKIFQRENETFEILHLCLDDRQNDAAKEFLRLGANPFHYELGQISAFQRANIEAPSTLPFFEACLKKLDDDVPDQRGLLQALKLSMEKKWSDSNGRVSRWIDKFTERTLTDQDGWTLDDLKKQDSSGFLRDRLRVIPSDRTAPKGPTRLIIPNHWPSKADLSGPGSLSLDGNQVHFLGASARSVRTDHPFPPVGISGVHYYFEIEIQPKDEKSLISPAVGIGLCGEYIDIGCGFTGWTVVPPSTGYHGDDGSLYESSSDYEPVIQTGKKFGGGDTVGCGIDWDKDSVYYTLNGVLVGKYASALASVMLNADTLD
ncbi:ankyrin repeat-containing domain protein [Nemania abortiva]|nr:ankyrin repeat-containing domain protein [Nemania abortiva]